MKKKLLCLFSMFLSVFSIALGQKNMDCYDAQILVNKKTLTIPRVEDNPDTSKIGCLEAYSKRQTHWFKFEITKSGTFDFIVEATDRKADYDYSLFKKACPCVPETEMVACNWQGWGANPPPNTVYYATGVSSDSLNNLAFQPREWIEFDPSIKVKAGEVYYLIVNNITANHVGFTIHFGGTAEIGAPKNPIIAPLTTVTGAKEVCANSQNVTYTVPKISGSTYKWTIPEGATLSGSGNTVNVNFGTTGGKICVNTENNCYKMKDSACIVVDVQKIDAVYNTPLMFCSSGCVNLDTISMVGANRKDFSLSFHNSLNEGIAGTKALTDKMICQADTIWIRTRSSLGCIDIDEIQLVRTVSPSVVLMSEGILCPNEKAVLTFSFTGTPPFSVRYTDGINMYAFKSNSLIYNDTISTILTQSTVFSLISFNDASGVCEKVLNGTATYKIIAPIKISNVRYLCDKDNFRVIFTVSGGDSTTYKVGSIKGKFNGRTFTSDEMPNGSTYDGMVSDMYACNTALITGNYVCNDCSSNAGTMDLTPLTVCETDIAKATFIGGNNLQPNDIQQFILHEMADNSLGTVYDINDKPEFSYKAGLTYNKDYYISSIVGPKNAEGKIDYSSACLSISSGTPVRFQPHIKGQLNLAVPNICRGDSTMLIFKLLGATAFDVIYSDGDTTQMLSNIKDGHFIFIKPSKTTVYQLISIKNTSNSSCAATLGNPVPLSIQSDCACPNRPSPGTMSSITPIYVCGDIKAKVAHNNNAQLRANDVLIFVLHDKAGKILATAATPEFAKPTDAQIDTTYFIAALAAPKNANSNAADIQSLCATLSAGTPVVFLAQPTVALQATPSACAGQPVVLTFNMTGTPPFNLAYSDGSTTKNLKNLTVPVYQETLGLSKNTTFSMLSFKDNRCSGRVEDINASVKIQDTLSAQNILVNCNKTGSEYFISLELNNNGKYEIKSNINGSWQNNIFTSTNFKEGSTYRIEFTTENSCKPLMIIGKGTCPCKDAAKPIITVVSNVTCAGSSDGQLQVSGSADAIKPILFQWNNGSKDAALKNLKAGIYKVTMTYGNGCVAMDSVSLKIPTPINAAMAVTPISCFGQRDGKIVVTNITGGTAPYTLTANGKTDVIKDTFSELASGIYKLKITDKNGCTWENQTNLEEPQPLTIDAGQDQEIVVGESIELKTIVNQTVDSIVWQAKSSLSCLKCDKTIAKPTTTTEYIVSAIKGVCRASDAITIKVDKNRKIFIPSAFSPNQDGENDRFMVYTGAGVARIIKFSIFNRWGQMVFNESNIAAPIGENNGWDGTAQGADIPNGVYIYLVEIEFTDGKKESFSGDITLLR